MRLVQRQAQIGERPLGIVGDVVEHRNQPVEGPVLRGRPDVQLGDHVVTELQQILQELGLTGTVRIE